AQGSALFAFKLVAIDLAVARLILRQCGASARQDALDRALHARVGVIVTAARRGGGRRIRVFSLGHRAPLSHWACRACGALRWGAVDHYFAAVPAAADDRREISVVLDGYPLQVETARGVFSPGHVDLGTTVLLDTVGAPTAGNVLDLGCGWGPIALTAAIRTPSARVYAVDVNERALDLVSRNAARVSERIEIAPIDALRPDAVDPSLRFDALRSNPPIRIGKAALHELLTQWVPRVKAGGEVWL